MSAVFDAVLEELLEYSYVVRGEMDLVDRPRPGTTRALVEFGVFRFFEEDSLLGFGHDARSVCHALKN